jgi:hypothetical protein
LGAADRGSSSNVTTRAFTSGFVKAAELVVVELPPIVREARRLRELWSEQDVLDPAAATDTLRLLADELDRADPAMRTLRERQNEIVRELRGVSDDSV